MSKEYNGKMVILCLYVDDILIFGANMNVINDVKKLMKILI